MNKIERLHSTEASSGPPDGLEIVFCSGRLVSSSHPLTPGVVTHHLPDECGPGAATIGDEVRQTFGGRIFSGNLEEDRELPAQQPSLSKIIYRIYNQLHLHMTHLRKAEIVIG